MNEQAETLKKLANELTEPSTQSLAVADQVINRAAAAMADVHAHAMSRVTGMREQLDSLEKTIIEARARAEAHMSTFMRLVTEGEETIRAMEIAVARVEDHVIGGPQ
jgi:hypothetical protein